MKSKFHSGVFALFCMFFCIHVSAQQVGIFQDQSDVGKVKHPGKAVYNAETQQYNLEGSGSNIWATHDEFHFVWRKIKGDFILRTYAAFIGKGVEAHRKVGLMIRTSLDTGSRHVNAVVHGDGLTSLQFRRTVGGQTEEMKSTVTHADVIQLERKGNSYIMSVARNGDTFTSEKLDSLDLGDEVYVGIFICSHNADVTEKAVFNNTRVVVPAPPTLVTYKQYLGSNIEILDVANQNSKIIYQTPVSIQAPNWTVDNKSLIYVNQDGHLYNHNLKTNTPVMINTAGATHNNNDHVLSLDGKMLTISSGEGDHGASVGFIVPVGGGEAKRMTKIGGGPSYMHGWSPDKKYLVFCGSRNGEFDIYRVAVADAGEGKEERLTNTPGLDDGPEYSPDGKYIYFNSVRSGSMQVYRMKADGTEQTQLTNDDFNNWFPHISPDGKWIVFITFMKDEVQPGDHPFYKHVYLRLMPIEGGKPKVIAYLYGGQGTINTPSWAPDGKHLAFISNTNLLFPGVYPQGTK